MGERVGPLMKQHVTFLYSRTGKDVCYTTKVRVLGHDTVVFLDTILPPDTTRAIKKQFLTDAFNAGMKQYAKLHKK